jgi:hypothetical protein
VLVLIVLIILGALAFLAGFVVGIRLVSTAYDAERLLWITSGTEIEAKAIKAQEEAEMLRLDNIRLLDEKLSAS